VITARYWDVTGAGFYIKISSNIQSEDLRNEAQRSAWLRKMGRSASAVVKYVGNSHYQMLVTREVEGPNGIESARVDFSGALFAIGQKLKEIHDIPIDECPFASDEKREDDNDQLNTCVIHGDPTLSARLPTARSPEMTGG